MHDLLGQGRYHGLLGQGRYHGLLGHGRHHGLLSQGRYHGLLSQGRYHGLLGHQQYLGLLGHQQYLGLLCHQQYLGLLGRQRFPGLLGRQRFAGLLGLRLAIWLRCGTCSLPGSVHRCLVLLLVLGNSPCHHKLSHTVVASLRLNLNAPLLGQSPHFWPLQVVGIYRARPIGHSVLTNVSPMAPAFKYLKSAVVYVSSRSTFWVLRL